MNKIVFLLLSGLFFILVTSFHMNADELKFEPVTKAKGLSYRYKSSNGRIVEVKDAKATEVKTKNKGKSRSKSKAKPKAQESSEIMK